MEQRTEDGLSPYRVFSRAEWAERRADTPMTLTPKRSRRVRSLHDRLDIEEVEEIYLPLTRLLSLYVAATQRLFRAQQDFLGHRRQQDAVHHRSRRLGCGRQVDHGARVAGAAGALAQRSQSRSRYHRRLSLPNAILAREGLMEQQRLSGKL